MPTPAAWLENLENLRRIANVTREAVPEPEEEPEVEGISPEEARNRFVELDTALTAIAEETIRLLAEAPEEVKVPLLKFILGLCMMQAFDKVADAK